MQGLQKIRSVAAAGLLIAVSSTSDSPLRSADDSQATSQERRPVEIWISIGSEAQQLVLDGKKARQKELLQDVQTLTDKVKQIQDGPCRCGAASHGACKTPNVCEPIEKAQMDCLTLEARRTFDEYELEAAFVKQWKHGPAEAALAARRMKTLQEQVARERILLGKLQAELDRSGKRTAEENTLRWDDLNYLRLTEHILDEILSGLLPVERATYRQVKDAIRAAIAAYDTDDETKTREALHKAFIAARGSLRELPRLTPGSKAALEATNRLYELSGEAISIHDEWDKTHNVTRLRERLPVLLEMTADVVEAIPGGQLPAKTFKTANDVTSKGIYMLYALEEVRAVRRFHEKQAEAQQSLRRDIDEVTARIQFQESKIASYEKIAHQP